MVKISTKRYLVEENLKRLMGEKGFLLKNIMNSNGELMLCLRDNYFNIYYYGNCLAKVSFHFNNMYSVEINEKIIAEEILKDPNLKNTYKTIPDKNNETIYRFNIENYKLKNLFQRDYILALEKNIMKACEDLYNRYEHIRDNLIKEKVFIMDLDITDDFKKINLTGIKNIEGNAYKIVIGEVKTDSSIDLKDSVNSQNGSCSSIKNNFKECKYIYEKQYHQLKQLGLLPDLKYDSIIIDEGIEGIIV